MHIGLGAWELAADDARTSVELEPGYTKGESSFAHIAMHASCGVLRAADIPDDIPMREQIIDNGNQFLGNGGSTIVGPDGQMLIEPVAEREVLITATLQHAKVRQERQNFDPAGHYSRPDVLQLRVDQRRQSTVVLNAEDPNEQ